MERKKETTIQLIDVAIGILSHFEDQLPFPFYVINLKDHSISLANQHATKEGGINSCHRCSALAHPKDNELVCCPEGGHNFPVGLVKFTI